MEKTNIGSKKYFLISGKYGEKGEKREKEGKRRKGKFMKTESLLILLF